MKKFALIAALAIAPSATLAGVISGDHIGCATKDAIEELGTAASNRDVRQFELLMQTECVPIQGFEYSVVDRQFPLAKVRLYHDSGSVVIWTFADAVR